MGVLLVLMPWTALQYPAHETSSSTVSARSESVIGGSIGAAADQTHGRRLAAPQVYSSMILLLIGEVTPPLTVEVTAS
jgi:hypothetical protein